MLKPGHTTWLLLGLASFWALAANADSTRRIDVPAGGLLSAIEAVEKQSDVEIVYQAEKLKGLKTGGVSGNWTTQEAVLKLLEGTRLRLSTDASTGAMLIVGVSDKAAGTMESTIRLAQASFTPSVADQTSAAQQDAQGSQENHGDAPLEEVVITYKDFRPRQLSTGSKTNTPLIEVPQSISVLAADRIEAIGAHRLKEALAYTPGVNTSPWGDESQYDWVYLRGFDAYSPGFYLDGLQLRNSGTWGVWQTENYGAEQIEFLRGPSSALYGQNGPGGLINVVSKQPLKQRLGEMKVQVGSHRHRQVAGDFSGPISEDDTWLYRFTALGQDAELSTGDLRNDRLFVAPAVAWRPSDDTTLTLLTQYLRIRSGSVWPSFPAIGTLLPTPNGRVPVSTFIGEPDFNRYDQDQWMIGYLLDHRLSDTWTLRQSARYGRYDVDYKTFYGGPFETVNPADPDDPANFRLLSRAPFSSIEDTSAVLLDNQAQASLVYGRWQHTVLFGLDYQRTRMDVLAVYGGSAPLIDAFAPTYGGLVTLGAPFLDSESKLLQTGAYVQDQIKFNERWVATLSGRFDHASVDSRDLLSGGRSEQTDEEFTSRAGLVYLAPNGWAPYLSYSESFSPNVITDPLTGQPFDPEIGRQYEVGLRYQPVGRTDSISAVLFDVRRQNHVIYNSLTFVPVQSGETLTRGIELEAVVRPTEGLNVTAAYSWTPKAEVIASINPSEIGKQATPVPRHQFSTWIDYQLHNGLNFGLGVRYTGSTRGFNEAAPAQIPDYVLFDALAGYNLGPWALALNARNLTGKEYVASCDGSGTSCYYGATRSFVATVGYRW